LSQQLAAVPGVARVDYFAAPVAQLSGLSTQLRSLGTGLAQGAGLDQLALLQTAGNALTGLALAFSGIASSSNFQQAATDLAQAGGIAAQLAQTPPASQPALLSRLAANIIEAADDLDKLVAEFGLSGNTPFNAYILNTYFSQDRTIARINVVLKSNLDSAGQLAAVAALRSAVGQGIASSSSLTGSSYYVGGEEASRADIMLVNDADFSRVFVLVVLGVLIVIIILLRSLLAPLYMVATVLLNYGATLGLATWVFLDLMHNRSVIYLIPLFIFVILVALGADYNIFLVSRIREESHHLPAREAVSRAVANTGGVITACGIILAGTFATLMTSPLQVVFQIGAAVSAGILIDTFLVRALLVPALAAITGRWSWWPAKLSRQSETPENAPEGKKGI
jgi:uncharacterized membrane protein YdfJ with MMPL/SSD domain